MLADGLAELQVRYPAVPIVFCETRTLAEEWTYRYLAAAAVWRADEGPAIVRMASAEEDRALLPVQVTRGPSLEIDVSPSVRDLRRWAVEQGIPVSDRGRLRPEVAEAWRRAHDDAAP